MANTTKKARYNLKAIAEYLRLVGADYASMDFVKPGLVLGTLGSLISSGGSGKTYLALENGMLIAIGRGFKKGGVLYLPAEDPIEEIGKRLQAIEKAFNLTKVEKEEAAKNFKVWPLLGSSPDLLEQLDDDSRPLVDAICEIAKTFTHDPLRIIIFDTLRRFSYADENDGGQMSKVLSSMEIICKRIGCCCFFLHHASKSAALSGAMETQQAARGSSVLSDNIRYQEFMRGMNDDESERLGEVVNGRVPAAIGGARNRFIIWGVSKQNYGFPVSSVWYKRNDDGVLMPVQLGLVEKNNNGRRNNGY